MTFHTPPAQQHHQPHPVSGLLRAAGPLTRLPSNASPKATPVASLWLGGAAVGINHRELGEQTCRYLNALTRDPTWRSGPRTENPKRIPSSWDHVAAAFFTRAKPNSIWVRAGSSGSPRRLEGLSRPGRDVAGDVCAVGTAARHVREGESRAPWDVQGSQPHVMTVTSSVS